MGQAIVTVFDHLSRIFQIMRHHKAPTEQILLLPCGQETPFRHTYPVAPRRILRYFHIAFIPCSIRRNHKMITLGSVSFFDSEMARVIP